MDYLDREKREVPEILVPLFIKADEEAKRILQAIKDLVAVMKEIYSEEDPVWGRLNISHFNMHIYNLRQQIKYARPWAYCPVCGGDGGVKLKGGKGNCRTCSGKGWLIYLGWQAVPEDQR